MKGKWGSIKQLLKFGLVLMMGISMGACSKTTWKEEVQLSDGRVVVVERELLMEGGGGEWAHNRSLSKPKEQHVFFSHPNGSGQMVEWRSTKLSPATWPEIPLILDIEDGRPVVFSIVSTSEACEQYLKYVYRNNAWIEDVLPATFEMRMTNLMFQVGIDMPNLVNLDQKRKANDVIGYRNTLKQVGPSRQVCGL